MEETFTEVCVNDGATFFLPGAEYLRIHKLRLKMLSRGGDELLDEGTMGGGRVSFRVSEILYLSLSTPGTRKFIESIQSDDFDEEAESWKKK